MPPPKKKGGAGKVILIVLGSIVGLFVLLAVVSSVGGNKTVATATSAPVSAVLAMTTAATMPGVATPAVAAANVIPSVTAVSSTVANATATPVALSAAAIPQKLQGTGQKASPPISLAAGLTIFKMTHSGSSNFAVTLLDKDAKMIGLLANVIGSYNGSTAIRVPAGGQFSLNVDANGLWTIEALQPGKAEQAIASSLPQTFMGPGPLATPLFTSNGGALRLTMKHAGKSNFAVTVLDSQGNLIDLAANVIGSFDGSKVVRLPRQGTYLLVVEADGPWSIGANP